MKKIMKFFLKFKNILVVAHSSRMMLKKDLTSVQQDRLDICKTCKLNSDNSKKLSLTNRIFLGLNKIVNKFYGLKITVNAICTYCNCDLSVMSSVDNDEHECKLGKWKY